MPRSTQSLTNRVLDYFRSQPLETATLMLELVTDAVRERRSKSQKAKARAQGPTPDAPDAPLATAPAATKGKPGPKAKPKTTGPKKSHKKQPGPRPAPAGESEPDLPLDNLTNPEPPDLGDMTPDDAGDLETVGVGMGSGMPPPGGRR